MKETNDTTPCPPPTRWVGMLAAVGPGVVVAGSVMGGGELINAPIQAAKFGFVLFWAVLLACVIKYFLQVEIGRHALVHGRTTLEALNSLPGPKVRGTSLLGLAYMCGYVFTNLGSVGMMLATAGLLNALVPELSVTVWAFVVFGFALAVLWRGVYGEIEKVTIVLVFLFSVGGVVGLFLIQGTPHRITAEDIQSGLTFSLGPDLQLAAVAVVSLLGALGATANELYMYPYWLLEKGYAEKIGPPDSVGWADRARGWIRVLQVDAGVCTILATVVTAAYFLMAAAVFHGSPDPIPKGIGVLDGLSKMFTASYGGWSRWFFAVGALSTLFSTIIVVNAAAGRMWTDLFASLKLIDGKNRETRRRCHRTVQVIYLIAVLVVALSLGKPPAELVIFGAWVAGIFCTPIIMIGICWLAFRTDRRVRMGRVTATLLIASVVVITLCVLTNLVFKAIK